MFTPCVIALRGSAALIERERFHSELVRKVEKRAPLLLSTDVIEVIGAISLSLVRLQHERDFFRNHIGLRRACTDFPTRAVGRSTRNARANRSRNELQNRELRTRPRGTWHIYRSFPFGVRFPSADLAWPDFEVIRAVRHIRAPLGSR